MKDSEITAIRQAVDIVDIISDYIPLIQKGKNHFAVCPFHDDHKPSMVISKEKQIFNCFTCHTGGNVFTFVMKYENVSFLEAIKLVAKKAGLSINITDKNEFQNNKYKVEYEIMDLSNKYYMNILNTPFGQNAKKYLKERGITEEIIKNFKIGLASKEKDSLYKFLTNHDYLLQDIDNIGLINKSGIDIYDTFLNRIMIPITNLTGQIVGYTGRIYNNEDTAKYVNSKETGIFKKSEIIFNYYNAKNYIRNEGKIVVVEGNMDAIKLYASGIKNVVALMGVALSKFHIDALKKLRVPVVLMLDNDIAGLNATLKNGDLLKEYGIPLEVVRLKGAKDPDEYVRVFGVEALKDNINHATKYLDFRIDNLKENSNLNSTEGLILFIKEVIKIIQNEDEITKEILINKIAKENNINPEIIKKEAISNIKQEKIKILPKENDTVHKNVKLNKYSYLTEKLLYYMLNDAKYIEIFKTEIGCFNELHERNLFNEINYFYKNNGSGVLADFLSNLENNNDKNMAFALQIVNNNIEEELDYENFLKYIKAMQKVLNNLEIKKLKLDIKLETDINEKMKLINQMTKLKKGCVDNERN